MESKYLNAAAQAIVEASKLSEQDRARIQELEGEIKLARAAESNAHRLINDDVKNNKLSPEDALVEKAKVTGVTNVKVKDAETKIRKMNPNWSANALETAKKLADAASHAAVKAADKAGEGVGTVANTPVQTVKSFFGSAWNKAKQSIK